MAWYTPCPEHEKCAGAYPRGWIIPAKRLLIDHQRKKQEENQINAKHGKRVIFIFRIRFFSGPDSCDSHILPSILRHPMFGKRFYLFAGDGKDHRKNQDD
jgi:hypothetical protein